MLCQFNHQPCQYIECPLWDEGQQRCLFHLAILKILGRPEKAPAGSPFLTAAQRGILEMIAWGCSYRDMAQGLNISPKTVGKRVADLLQTLQAKTRAHAVTIAVKSGIISFEKEARSR